VNSTTKTTIMYYVYPLNPRLSDMGEREISVAVGGITAVTARGQQDSQWQRWQWSERWVDVGVVWTNTI